MISVANNATNGETNVEKKTTTAKVNNRENKIPTSTNG